MANQKKFTIHHGCDYRVLDVPGYEPIVFGCPPGLVKDFAKRKSKLPRHYVFPTQTVVRGVNIFDFEFVIYSFLFFEPEASRVTVYCTLDQRARFKSILTETLFGPSLSHLLQAQNYKWTKKQNFSIPELKRFNTFLRKITKNNKLKKLFDESLRSHSSEKRIEKDVCLLLKDLVFKEKWLSEKSCTRLSETLAASYCVCMQIKNEMDGFALVDEAGQDEFLNKIVDFRLFDKMNCVEIQNDSGKKAPLKIKKRKCLDFEFFRKNTKLGSLELSPEGDSGTAVMAPAMKKPFMGVSFLGVGSGFSPKRRNSCLIAWSEGKGIMVDSVSGQSQILAEYGLCENDVSCIFLTHVHSDHDVGLLERILSERKTQIISTRIIFESFLRKLEAVSGMSCGFFEQFIDFIEVEAQKPKLLPGFKSTYFTFDYSFHSIPTGRFRLAYIDPEGKETVVSHSGDTKFNAELVGELYNQGKLSKKRRDDIMGFIWEADLIVHDVGGGSLHTKLSELDGLKKSVMKKMVLVHQHEDPLNKSKFEFACEGQTKVVIQSDPNGKPKKGR